MERNYYSVELGSVDEGWVFLVQRIVSEGLNGIWFEGGFAPGYPASFPNASLAKCTLKITYYIRELQISYNSAAFFLILQIILIPWIQVWRERVSQLLFNQKKLVRSERIEILRLLLDQRLRDHNFAINSGALMDLLYGGRWAGHPDNVQLHQYYILLLNSLVESGDLALENNVYRLSPRALSTLSQFEEDNRKHRDMVIMQGIIAVLTLALVLVGLMQVIALFFDSN